MAKLGSVSAMRDFRGLRRRNPRNLKMGKKWTASGLERQVATLCLFHAPKGGGGGRGKENKTQRKRMKRERDEQGRGVLPSPQCTGCRGLKDRHVDPRKSNFRFSNRKFFMPIFFSLGGDAQMKYRYIKGDLATSIPKRISRYQKRCMSKEKSLTQA